MTSMKRGLAHLCLNVQVCFSTIIRHCVCLNPTNLMLTSHNIFLSFLGIDRLYVQVGSGSGQAMDNCATCCTGGSSGYCSNDLIMKFYDRLGRTCTTRWLVNNWRWHYGKEGTNGNDAFDSHSWDGFTWKDAGCVKENGFDVPNKVRITH